MRKTLFIITLSICAAGFLAGLALYPRLPALVPLNWNTYGQITNYGKKWHTLILISIPAIVSISMYLMPRFDPRRRNYARFPKAYAIFSTATPLILLVLMGCMYAASFGLHIPVGSIISGMMGLLFLVMGNYMPQVRSSYFVGIRTPWALENEQVWRRTHRFGGMVFVFSGAAFILCAFVGGWAFGLALALLFGGVALTYLYSFLVYRGMQKTAADNAHEPNPKEENHAEH